MRLEKWRVVVVCEGRVTKSNKTYFFKSRAAHIANLVERIIAAEGYEVFVSLERV